MVDQWIEFTGKHPRGLKEDRVYYDDPSMVESCESYGISYRSGFLKVDIDDYDHKTGEPDEPIHGRPRSEAVVAALDSLGIRFNGIKTENGKHLFFRVPPDMEHKTKPTWYCPIGVKLEWKFPESDDHIPLKINGVKREFFRGSVGNSDVDELPAFLYPLQKGKAAGRHKFDLNFPEGDRTQKLGAYLFHLAKEGFTAEQAFQIVRVMNEFIFESPIPEQQLNAEILNNSTLEKLKATEKNRNEKNIPHSELAKEIIERFSIISLAGGKFYAYENGVYKPFQEDRITQYLTENYPKLNGNYEREVIRHIRGLSLTDRPKDDGTVNVRNGILKFSPEDGSLECLKPHSPDVISFRQFNAAYDPEAKCEMLDAALDQWFNGSSEQIELFNQVLGYLLMNHVNYQKIIFFVGKPSTGKTTLLNLITEFCGKENVSSVQLEDMGKQFGLAPIVDKTANIFGDIRKSKVLTSDIFKMLADGSPVTINQKFERGFQYSYTGKLLFGMNSYPDFSKDFDGIERRLIIFEFRRVFLRGINGYDPFLLEKLKTDECMSVLLNRAIAGYGDLIRNGGFTTTKENDAALEDFVSENDSVVRWLRETDTDEDRLLRVPISGCGNDDLYPDYQSFCFQVGEEPKAQKDFSRSICGRFGYETHTKRINGSRPQMFRKKK